MQALTFNQCVTNAWVDAWRIAKQNPLFLTSAVAAYYLMGIAFEATTGTVKHAPLGMLASLCASYSLKVLLLSVVAVQTQRFIVLEENRLSRPALFGAPYWRFVLLNFGVNAFPVAIVSVVAGSWNALHILTSVPSIGRGGRAGGSHMRGGDRMVLGGHAIDFAIHAHRGWATVSVARRTTRYARQQLDHPGDILRARNHAGVRGDVAPYP